MYRCSYGAQEQTSVGEISHYDGEAVEGQVEQSTLPGQHKHMVARFAMFRNCSAVRLSISDVISSVRMLG